MSDSANDQVAESDADEPEPKPALDQSGVVRTVLGQSPEVASDAWIGRILDERYQIESVLGEGGMGAVFIARHLKLHKQVALKVVRAELAGNGEVAIRFAREAMATAQFEHPHVASAIDYGALPEGGAYFVMQLVAGRSLREMLEDGPLPWRTACTVMAQVADALSAARSKAIVHRDLKPDNIIVETRDDGSLLVKILDFGIAHVAPKDEPAPEGAMPQRSLTRVGTIIGTPGYMAPEQAVGAEIDHRTDLYSLGVVLWECISGKELWNGDGVAEIISRQMSEEPPLLADIAGQPDLPSTVDDCVQQLLARNPELRPEHAGQVRETLKDLARGESSTGSHRTLSKIRDDAISRMTAIGRNGQTLLVRHYGDWQQQPNQRRRKQAAVGGVGLCILLALTLSVDSEPNIVVPAANAKDAASVLDSVVQLATEIVQPKVEAIITPGIPADLADGVQVMMEGRRRTNRRNAAKDVLAYEPRDEVANYVIAVAELETARGCRTRKTAISAIVEAGDEAALPALKRWRRSPKNGCGFLKLQDCNDCIRVPLRRAIRKLSGK